MKLKCVRDRLAIRRRAAWALASRGVVCALVASSVAASARIASGRTHVPVMALTRLGGAVEAPPRPASALFFPRASSRRDSVTHVFGGPTNACLGGVASLVCRMVSHAARGLFFVCFRAGPPPHAVASPCRLFPEWRVSRTLHRGAAVRPSGCG